MDVECTEAQWREQQRKLITDLSIIPRCQRCKRLGVSVLAPTRIICMKKTCGEYLCNWCAFVDTKRHAKEHGMHESIIGRILLKL